MRSARPALLFGLLLLPACCFDELHGGWDQTSCQLKPAPDLPGDYRLNIQVGGMTLRSRSARQTEQPVLGMELSEVNKEFAEGKGLRPFCGLFVQSVESGGPAAAGGVVPGEILQSINGVEVFYLGTFHHHLQRLKPGDACTLGLTPRGDGERREVKLQVGREVSSGHDEDVVELALAEGNSPPVFGFQFATLPAEWTRKIYGEDKPAVLLGAVELGSPGYRAGLRPGDRLVRVDRKGVEDAAAFRERLRVWGRGREAVAFEVRGARGDTYQADVVLGDYQGESEICAPLIMGAKNNPRMSRVGVGPLHILTNYRREYEVSGSRDSVSSGSYSLGWGLFHYRWSPGTWNVRVLWLITFGSD